MLSGKKTYLVTAVMIVYAVAGFFLGKMDANSSVQMVFEALAVAGLRNAVK